MLKAVTRQATAVDAKIKDLNADLPPGKSPISTANFFDHHAKPEDIAVMVTEQDFLEANRELVPSVSAGELQHYEKVRATFEGGRDRKDAAASGANNGQASATAQSVPTGSEGPRSSGKGKGKAVVAGKGKAVATDDSEDESDDGDSRAYGGSVNGKGKDKGKAVMRFEQGTGSDDDGLY